MRGKYFYRNWKTNRKFLKSRKSTTHRDASTAWIAQKAKPIDAQLNSQTDKIKSVRTQDLITQIKETNTGLTKASQ